MKKVLIVSDSHGKNDNLFETIKKEKADVVIHAGDYDDFNLKPMDEGKPPVFKKFERDVLKDLFHWWCKGNHDYSVKRPGIDDPKEFEQFIFNSFKIFQIENVKVLLSHFLDDSRKEIYFGNAKGTPNAIKYEKGESFEKWMKELIELEKPNLIITGHTHVPREFSLFGVKAINPGSISVPKKDTKPSYVTLEIDGSNIKNIDFKKTEPK